MLGAEIQRLGRDWTIDSLELAYANLKESWPRDRHHRNRKRAIWDFTMSSIKALSGRELIALRKNDETSRAIDRVIARYNASKAGQK